MAFAGRENVWRKCENGDGVKSKRVRSVAENRNGSLGDSFSPSSSSTPSPSPSTCRRDSTALSRDTKFPVETCKGDRRSWIVSPVLKLIGYAIYISLHFLRARMSIGLASFWIVWKFASAPLLVLKWLLTLFRTRAANGVRKRTVLISGGSTVQALHLARNFYSAGARVVVCEIEGLFGLARFSTAVHKFYTVSKPEGSRALDYVDALRAIVEKERVSYYIPVSATTEAFYDALAKPQLELLNCIVFCPPFKDVLFFDDLFEVLNKCREIGLKTPSYHRVTSRDDVFRLYESGTLGTGEHFMANVDPLGREERVRIRVPPLRRDFRFSREISHRKPWIVVGDVGGERYVTCTTVKEAYVVGNVTCRIENGGTGGLVPVDKREILDWIRDFFCESTSRSVSGHFNFTFAIPSAGGSVVPLDCRVGVSLPYICFTSVHPRIVWKPCRHFSRQSSGPLVANEPRYWMHDAVLFALRHPSRKEALARLIETVLDEREAVFAYWDPLPYCAYYNLQLPLANLVDFVLGKRVCRSPTLFPRTPTGSG